MRSFSREGVSQTWVIFKLGVDLEDAANQVRERVSQIRYRLPEDAREPVVARFDVSAAPIATYTLRGARSLSEARRFADEVIRPALEQVPGVAAVDVQGGAEREIQVELDRAKLDALSLASGMVAQRLRAENLNVPAGHFDEGAREISVRTVGEFPSVEAIRDVIVATAPDGASVRLRDVGVVVDGFEEQRTLARVNGTSTVTFDVLKQSGQNTVAVADRSSRSWPSWRRSSRPTPRPRSSSIRRASSRVGRPGRARHRVRRRDGDPRHPGLHAGSALDAHQRRRAADQRHRHVLRHVRARLHAEHDDAAGAVAGIGLLIDDAVVVRENIFKHLERGKPPMQAALDGTKEIALTVLATTLTIVAVFLPVAFVKGMVGQFFRQFGITISPPSCSRCSSRSRSTRCCRRASRRGCSPGSARASQRSSGRSGGSSPTWSDLPAHPRLGGAPQAHRRGLAIASMFMAAFLMKLTGAEFVNAEDRGQFVVEVELGPGTSLAETASCRRAPRTSCRKNPEVRTVLATIGPLGEVNKVSWRVVTSPKKQRTVELVGPEERRARGAPARPARRQGHRHRPAVRRGRRHRGADHDQRARRGLRRDRAGRAQDRRDPQNHPGGARHPGALLAGPPRAARSRSTASARPIAAWRWRRWRSPCAPRSRATKPASCAWAATRSRSACASEERPRAAGGSGPLQLMTPKGPVRLGDVASFARSEGPQVIERENRQRQITIWAHADGDRSATRGRESSRDRRARAARGRQHLLRRPFA